MLCNYRPFDVAATASDNLRASQTVRSAATAAPLSEEKRAQLREIEMKVMQYQDDLESGRKKRGQGSSINELVDEFRQKLLDKVCIQNVIAMGLTCIRMQFSQIRVDQPTYCSVLYNCFAILLQ